MVILLVIFGIIAVTIVFSYNNLINKKNRVDQAYGSIDVMLKKRQDLIPNLVATVQEYAEHEKGLLTDVTELRSQAIKDEGDTAKRFEDEAALTQKLRTLMVNVENYPNLKANTNFLQLQGTLHEVEEQISAARRAYNASILDLNNAVEMFPSNIIAKEMKLTTKEMFEIPDEERQNVNVKELFKN